MPTRCFWPPDSCRGIRSAKARGSFTRSSSSSIRSRRSASFAPNPKISSARMICRPTVIDGFSVSNGFWNTIWIVGDGLGVALLDGDLLDVAVVEQDLALGGGLQPHQHLGEGRLAAARFADDGQRFGFARLEAERLVGLDHLLVAAAEQRVGRHLVVFLQVVHLQDHVADLALLLDRGQLQRRLPVDLVEFQAARGMAVVAGHLLHRDIALHRSARPRNNRSAGRSCSRGGARAAAGSCPGSPPAGARSCRRRAAGSSGTAPGYRGAASRRTRP